MVIASPSRPGSRFSPDAPDPGRAREVGGDRPRPPAAASLDEVLVVFVDHAACQWLRLLRRGFRHCFVVKRLGPFWLACEPLKDRIDLDLLELPPGFDLARFYGEQGHRVLLGRRPAPLTKRRFACAPLTCVTVVKRVLAIHAPGVWTPFQLHTHLLGPTCGFRKWSDRDGRGASGREAQPSDEAYAALDIVV